MTRQLASILVGDHLGQVKKVLLPSGEISILPDLAEPTSSNPVVSIKQIGDGRKHLIANSDGQLYTYDPVHGETHKSDISGDDSLLAALPISPVLESSIALVYEKQVTLDAKSNVYIKQKKGQIVSGKIRHDNLAFVGKDIPLKVYNIQTKQLIFEAEAPEKDWLGIKPNCVVAAVDFVAQTRLATCSKSDSVVRVYDSRGKTCKPIISIDINQTAFNEHAEAGRFVSVASTGDEDHKIVVGSNVGQLFAIDLRFDAKRIPKKRLQPKTYQILGGFKGARGATIKDLAITSGGDEIDYKVISCCLDRYLRIYNFSKSKRILDKHVYMKTKPLCCSPVFYEDN